MGQRVMNGYFHVLNKIDIFVLCFMCVLTRLSESLNKKQKRGFLFALGLIALIFSIGVTQKWFEKKYSYYSIFENSSGLAVGKELTYKGFSIGKVKSFVNAISQFEYDFDLISGRYVIDAKSIMGIFSLDLSKPIDLAIHTETNLDEVLEALKPYIIE